MQHFYHTGFCKTDQSTSINAFSFCVCVLLRLNVDVSAREQYVRNYPSLSLWLFPIAVQLRGKKQNVHIGDFCINETCI